MITRIETCRLMMGLGRAQMLSLIGARPHQLSLLIGQRTPPAGFVSAAERLLDRYLAWKMRILNALDRPMGTETLARLFGVPYERLYLWVRLGHLEPAGYKKSKIREDMEFDKASVLRLFSINESCLASHLGQRHQLRRGPLAGAFTDYITKTTRKKAA